MADLPKVKVWTAGDQPNADGLNQVGYALKWLTNPPHAYIYQTSAQSTANAAWTAISFSAELRDTDTMWTAGSPTRLTINSSGWWEFEYAIWWASAADTNWRLPSLRVNGTLFSTQTAGANNGQDIIIRGITDLYLYTGDYVELCSWQSSGGSLNTGGGSLTGDHSFLSALWTSM